MVDALFTIGHLIGAPCLQVVGALMGLAWIAALIRRDASIVDGVWGLGFVLLTWTAYAATQGLGDETRRIAIFGLVTAWGLRLSGHLIIRHAREGEDRRYARMRVGWGNGFAWKSLLFVFGLQGLLMLIISLPVLAVMCAQHVPPPGPLDFVALGLAAAGLLVEALADRQLDRFRADPDSNGAVMDRGLWRYSRHPNYFGESLFWHGIGLAAVAVGAPWAMVAPLLITVLLLRVSGVTLMEKTIGTRRPEYAAYVARTSAFLPWWPRKG